MATSLSFVGASNTSPPEDRKLSDIFEEAFRKYNELDQSELPGNSTEFQVSRSTADQTGSIKQI